METHRVSPESLPPKPTLEQLRHVVNNYPLIDNHAHNLLLPSHIDTVPFESITSEAQGRALRDTFKSLPHLRATRQLRELYHCSEDADWEEILDQRTEWLRSNPEKLYEECFKGTHALLMDDGLAGPDNVYDYSWHDRCTQAPTKRIVRIETVAERLMQGLLQDATETDLEDAEYFTEIFIAFTDAFEREIQHAIRDDEVCGFKTVICYRSGLDIEPDYIRAAKEVGYAFERYVARCVRKRKFRMERKALNDYLVLRALEVLTEHRTHPDGMSKPLQFHTGLGDNDISLRESNPAYLQPLIENYSHVPFVLLHTAYPYTRQAGYLATVYRHVYLDIGEVFPMVSRDGQKAILRQSLELSPGSKLLYSTDGHWFPETFWLANKQFREVWLELLTEYIRQGEMTPHQGINITKDLLFNNSNELYDLRYQADFKELDEHEPQRSLPWRSKEESYDQSTPIPPTSKFMRPESELSTTASPTFPPPPKTPQVYDIHAFDEFMENHPGTKYVYVQWLDYMATLRCRVVPIREFTRMIHSGSRITISTGNLGTLQNDTMTSIANVVGQLYIEPDLRSLRAAHARNPMPAATVFAFWRETIAGNSLPICPRTNLENLVKELQYNYNIALKFGFEIEVTFLRKSLDPSAPYLPLGSSHAWGSLTDQDFLQLPMLTEISESLENIGIELQQFHSEAGLGQYEFVLGPQAPLAAVDTLLQARQVIEQIAAKYDLRATLHPQPLRSGAGTGAHAHISVTPPDKEMEFFVGGVLKHIRALCAFTLPQDSSYSRVRDDCWTGGTWVAWGTQNRETPLRRVENGRWEVRCLDGFANMYLAMAGIIAAGLLGIKEEGAINNTSVPGSIEYVEKDVPVNPSQTSEEERSGYGIKDRMPTSADEAIRFLEGDAALREALGGPLVHQYLVMKEHELRMLRDMEEEKRRIWLLERY